MQALTRECLATYVYLEFETERIWGRIEYYEDHPVQQQYSIIKGSTKQFPLTECHLVASGLTIKSDLERKEIARQSIIDPKGNKQFFEDMRLDIETFLETLSAEDAEIKHTLGLKYVERKSGGEIAKKLNYSRKTIGLKIDKFPNMTQKEKKQQSYDFEQQCKRT